MNSSRLVGFSVSGMRTLEDVQLDLSGLTVLIGENGSGKSSIIEALEILRLASEGRFMDVFNDVHGGFSALARIGSSKLAFGARVEVDGRPYDYELVLRNDGSYSRLAEEWVREANPVRRTILQRSDDRAVYLDPATGQQVPQQGASPPYTFLSMFQQPALQPILTGVQRALAGIAVHVPLSIPSGWTDREQKHVGSLREPAVAQPAERLDRHGGNLANAYHALKNDFGQTHWKETLDLVRLGLGDEVDDVSTRFDAGGGRVSVAVKYRWLPRSLPAFSLSSGTLAYLAHVALYRLPGSTTLLAFDEPDTHLHPALLTRVVGFFEETARHLPVVVATHSDRLLDALSDPAAAAVLAELDRDAGVTRLWRPDAAGLEKWLLGYRGLGDIRSTVEPREVFTHPVAHTP